MAQHATIHGKNTTAFNGQSGSWLPIRVSDTGDMYVYVNSLSPGQLSQFNRDAGGAIFTQLDAGTTTVAIAGGPWIIYGVQCKTAGTFTSLTVNGVVRIGSTGAKVAGDVVLTYGGAGWLTDATTMTPVFTGTWDILLVPAV